MRVHPNSRIERPGGNPVSSAYLDGLAKALWIQRMEAEDVHAIVLEMDNHIAEAVRAGRPLAEVIQALGPPQLLAEAYCVALTFESSVRPPGWPHRLFRTIGGVARSIAAFLWLSIGAGLTFVLATAGSVCVVGALVLPYISPRILDPTLRVGLPQFAVFASGAAALVLARQLARWLRFHARFAHARPTLPLADDEHASEAPVGRLAYFPTITPNNNEEVDR